MQASMFTQTQRCVEQIEVVLGQIELLEKRLSSLGSLSVHCKSLIDEMTDKVSNIGDDLQVAHRMVEQIHEEKDRYEIREGTG